MDVVSVEEGEGGKSSGEKYGSSHKVVRLTSESCSFSENSEK